ncbi:MAG TPA: phosphoglycerate dehydrogenase, partial [Chthoniobacterales bacterium]|nr:phosphoglycerate dehydrogenase [Chthoniobacterales bacterium]
MTKTKILVADQISQRGIEELSRDESLEVVVRTGLTEDQLVKAMPEFSAVVVRSETKITASVLQAAKRLR